ncbi:tyrosine-type recombinase/integrase [Larkinella terrae]|uniref:tyrosine-type recombinase/integrase n=1 Tax=Larkinella terrae TaxID=2025311 RepID=UPI0034D958DF
MFESQIGYKNGRVTVKILRKTAGPLFLNKGYTLEVVQQVLGHCSISTTERHYGKNREMDRAGVRFV